MTAVVLPDLDAQLRDEQAPPCDSNRAACPARGLSACSARPAGAFPPTAQRAPIRREAPRRARENRSYRLSSRVFLAEHPRCEFPSGCTMPATEVHHRRGRVGSLLLDQRYWSGLCHDHHAFVTEHPKIAYEMGISELRVGVA